MLIQFHSISRPFSHFRKQVPMLYDGDLHQHDRILTWLTSQDVFEIKNEIEEVNRKMLDKLLEENEFLAVYFCMLGWCSRMKFHEILISNNCLYVYR